MSRSVCWFALAGVVLVGSLVLGNPLPPRRGQAPAPSSVPGGSPELRSRAVPADAGSRAQPRGEPARDPNVHQASTVTPAPAEIPLRMQLGGGAAVADPDRIGPCPGLGTRAPHASPVVRRAVDHDGWPTWWHEDGSLTKRVIQEVREQDGTLRRIPEVMRLTAAGKRPGADAVSARPAALSTGSMPIQDDHK